jgi:hypothetical protein
MNGQGESAAFFRRRGRVDRYSWSSGTEARSRSAPASVPPPHCSQRAVPASSAGQDGLGQPGPLFSPRSIPPSRTCQALVAAAMFETPAVPAASAGDAGISAELSLELPEPMVVGTHEPVFRQVSVGSVGTG